MAAGAGQSRCACDAPPERAGEAAPGIDFAACGEGGDRGDQQQGDQGYQACLLDARRPPL
jgi:hypothetical protein